VLTESHRTGEEIRSLSRFIGAQRLAFTKLLKKYKKWTRSDTLNVRFKSEVLNRPTSFTSVSLDSQFEDWTDILQAIRAARSPDAPPSLLEKGRISSPALHSVGLNRQRESSDAVAGKFGAAVESGSDVSFDAVFADVPIGEAGAKAVYWVHPEQLIELQVLLLQHLRLFIAKPALDPSSQPESPVITRRSSLSSQNQKEYDFGMIVLDDVEEYARRQSICTVSDSEDCGGRSFAKPTAIARWTSADEAIISLRQLHQPGNTGIVKVRKKYLGALLNVERGFESRKNSGISKQTDEQSLSGSGVALTPEKARELLEKHRGIKPLVSISARRTRFLGLSNSRFEGQWCVLDSQITIGKISPDDFVGTEWAANLGRDGTSFPYAILKVREEGKFAGSVIELLDKSHLVSWHYTICNR
jgi:hypothetical protein